MAGFQSPYGMLALVPRAISFARSALSQKCWYLIFSVTDRCNQRCLMCFNREEKDAPPELTLNEIRKLARAFPSLYQLTLSGGEPSIRPDLPEIISAFNSPRTVPRITLPSNGQLPEKLERLTSRLCRENPESMINVALSLDGVGEVHNLIRGVSNAFERHEESRKRIQALLAKHSNLSLVVASVLSSFNANHMDELIDYIYTQSWPSRHGIMLARGDTRDALAKNVDIGFALDVLNRFHAMQRTFQSGVGKAWLDVYHRNRIDTISTNRMIDPCLAGSKLLVLDARGELFPCEVLDSLINSGQVTHNGRASFGNVRDVDYQVDNLLNTPGAQSLTRFIRNGGCACTFECALLNNFALNWMNYPRVLFQLIKNLIAM